MAKIHLIIPAAGSSLRMGQGLPKQFTVLGNNKTLTQTKYQNVLPGTYGAIYKLTQIKETKLKSLLDSGKITSSTTRQTINILTKGNKESRDVSKKENTKRFLNVRLSDVKGLNTNSMRNFEKDLNNLVSKYKSNLKLDIEQFNLTKRLEERKKELSEKGEAIFPCELMVLKDHVYMKGGNDDLLVGIKVRAGRLLKGTPLITDKKVSLGKVISIQKNHKEMDEAKLREEVCIRIKGDNNTMYGRHFDYKDKIISEITRESIDELKRNFRDEMEKTDWKLIVNHMNILGISKNN